MPPVADRTLQPSQAFISMQPQNNDKKIMTKSCVQIRSYVRKWPVIG